tara:strand:+ start:220 stop:414 length:195 start_codon:yes stop_codon:yes gene_type:complete
MGTRIDLVGDWNIIVRLYNEMIDPRASAADTDYVSIENNKSWLKDHSEEQYPILFAVNNTGANG